MDQNNYIRIIFQTICKAGFLIGTITEVGLMLNYLYSKVFRNFNRIIGTAVINNDDIIDP